MRTGSYFTSARSMGGLVIEVIQSPLEDVTAGNVSGQETVHALLLWSLAELSLRTFGHLK